MQNSNRSERIKKCLNILKDAEKYFIYVAERVYFHKYHAPKTFPDLSNNKILILGNGPSAAKLSLDKFLEKGIDILCVNYFPSNHPDFFKVKPKYYCAIDPALYNTDKSNVENDMIHKLNDTLLKVDWNMYYICLSTQTSAVFTNPNIHPAYINNITYDGEYARNKLYLKNKANPGLQNVILAALYYCISGNADKIYLCGIENDWHRGLSVDKDNNVYWETVHFYGTEKINLIEAGQINRGEYYKYCWYYYNTMKQYHEVSKYAKYNNVQVYNLTLDSFVDVFDKISPDDLLTECGIK